MKLAICTLFAALALSVACDDDESSTSLPETSTPSASTGTPTPVVAGAPSPQSLTFDAGELIDVEDAGVFFIDIATGEAEAWVTPDSAGNPFAFTLVSMSADGTKLVYACMMSTTAGLASCDGGSGDTIINYLLDTETGERRALTAFSGDRRRPDRFVQQFVALSPDGETLLGIGADGALIRASSDEPNQVETIAIPGAGGETPIDAVWSPDGGAAVVFVGVAGSQPGKVVFVADDAASATPLVDETVSAFWSPDGARLLLVGRAALWMFDADGAQIWTKPHDLLITNIRWSPDGTAIAMHVTQSGDSTVPESIAVLDAGTGEVRFRIEAALACAGQLWNADGSRLLFGSYEHDGRLVLADPETRTFSAPPEWYGLTPNPADPNLAILFEGESFFEIDLRTGERTRTIAETTVSPAWFFDHEPLFAGDRIVFTAPHGGHGGCGEGGSAITDKPPPSFVFPVPGP